MNVLFICTHNASRSILAEAMMNHLDALGGSHRFVAYSAGSTPIEDGKPHAMVLEVLEHSGISINGLRSKHWSEFSKPDAPHMDLIITVCDVAAVEVCPVWPGHPSTVHWTFSDPSAGDMTESQRHMAYRHTLHEMGRRLELLLNLPEDKLQRSLLKDSALEVMQ
jgi:arsenate reductase